ncbi:unnamed protein product [Staurois parvus]|uniref:Uncharacterized protein n=1 Tax=Staurois parvus TaxID=386267 RepID=A0ABN9H565_9NEOB|nr:unnamed protein product [Staurois parvus]
MPRTCVNKADNFCYICGEITFISQKRRITGMIKQSLQLVFWLQDRRPGQELGTTYMLQFLWDGTGAMVEWKKKASMPFAVPMIWREPTDHVSNCYFCMVPPIVKGLNKKKKLSVHYPNIPSAIRPVPHGEGLPIPKAPESFVVESSEEEPEACSHVQL